jgi:HEAT repeat protein
MTVALLLVFSIIFILLMSTIGIAANPDVSSYPPFNENCTNAEVQQYLKNLSEPKQIDFASLALSACGSEAVSALTPLLNQPNRKMRFTAISILEKMGKEAKTALPFLIEAIKDPDLRSISAAAIGNIGSDAKAAIPALVASLREQWYGAAYALRRIGSGKAAVPALISALQDPNSENPKVIEAITAIGYIGKDAGEAVTALIAVLKFKDGLNQYYAAVALRKIGAASVPALIATLKDLNPTTVSTLGEIGTDAATSVPELTAMLKNSNKTVRIAVITALGKIKLGATPALISVLQDPDPEIRSEAISTLGKVGLAAKAAIPKLISILQDKNQNANILASTADTLGKMGTAAKAAVPTLIASTQDPNKNVRFNSISALGDIGSAASSSVPTLIDLLKQSSTQLPAIRSLGNIGEAAKAAIPALASVAQRKSNGNRYYSVKALGKIGKKAIPVLLNFLNTQDPELRSLAVIALRNIGSDANGTIPALIRVLNDTKSYVRGEVTTALGKYRIPFPLNVRGEVAAALGEFGIPSKETIRALSKILQDNDFVGDIAAESLGKLGKGSIPTLIQALQNSNEMVRLRSGKALGKIGLQAVPALITALKSKDLYIQKVAAFALGSIKPSTPTVINQLKEIVTNQKTNLDLRRITASYLELLDVSMQDFFSEYHLIGPNNASCPAINFGVNDAFYQFDSYTGKCLYVGESGLAAGGSSLFEVFCGIFRCR